nr:cysteine-rich receptor-like protein kinase [Tanacetum cinerariifolium]
MVKNEFKSYFSEKSSPFVRSPRMKFQFSRVLSTDQSAELELVFSKDEIKRLFGVVGRQIMDGLMILNEILNWCKKEKKMTLVFKVEFEKAHDSICWDYLQDVMIKMWFGRKWYAWIRGSLESYVTSILVNGSPTDEFRIRKGLRQGDPLYPFLFILAMEGLHMLIYRVIHFSQLHGLQIGNRDVRVSYLFYADDAIFLEDYTYATRWLKKVPAKVKIFIWRMLVNKLPTRMNLITRGINVQSNQCGIGDTWDEMINHLILHCDLARDMWALVRRWWSLDFPFVLTIRELMLWVDDTRLHTLAKKVLHPVVETTALSIWNFRNQNVFHEGKPKKALLFDNYIPWSSHLLRHEKSKSNGKLLLKSILPGSYQYRMIEEPGDPDEWTNCYPSVGNHNGNVIATRVENNEEAKIQLQIKEFDLMVAAVDCEEIEEVNANCILMANLQQASTLVTHADKAPVYDSYRSTEETCAFYESLYNNLVIEVEKVNTVNREIKEANEKLTAEVARNLDGVDMMKGNHSTNLYTINLHKMASSSPICLMARATSTEAWLWHQRLSHLNFNTIKNLTKDNLITGIPKLKYSKDRLCLSCEQGKSNKKSHKPKPVPNSQNRLHHLHMDLCGLIGFKSINGKRALCYPKNNHEDIEKLGAKDSGCSMHMTTNLKLLINFVWKFIGIVLFGNDHVAAIMGYDDLQWGYILIVQVYFVESLRHNLFLVGQFCNSNLEVAFKRNTCFVRNLDGVDMMKGNHSTNLYTINLHKMASSSPICLMARATSTEAWLWHQRLSHLNFNTIKNLTKDNLITGIPKLKYSKDRLCLSCEQGKSNKKSHKPKPVPNSQNRLHHLHMDLCGLIGFKSINGKRALCYPKNNHEDIEKLGAKDNIKPLTLKWIFKNKLDEEQTVIRNKARLVVRGYRHEEGIDLKNPSLRLLGWKLSGYF